MTSYLFNGVAYSLQLAVLVAAALAVTGVLRLGAPRAALRFWQAVLVAAILLPFLQSRTETLPAAFSSSAALLATTASAPAAAVTAEGVSLNAWLVLAVAAGILLRSCWLALGFIRLRRIIVDATPAASLQPLAHTLSESIHATAAIALSDDVQVPATVGVRRPLILLPRRILEMPVRVQRAVIAHELVHVSRRDWLQTLLEEFWCAILWFHPAARLLASRLSMSREMVVDEATLLVTRDRRAYAQALLAFASPQPHLPGVTPLISRRQLSQRISLIAEEAVMSFRRVLTSLVIALLVCTAATAAAVTVVPMSVMTAQKTKVYKPGNGVSLPSIVKEVKPVYSPAAMKQKIQGTVWMAVVVLESGDVGEVRISKSLDAEYGLDQEAIKAAKQWKFKPALRAKKPVAVEVTVEMTFTLK